MPRRPSSARPTRCPTCRPRKRPSRRPCRRHSPPIRRHVRRARSASRSIPRTGSAAVAAQARRGRPSARSPRPNRPGRATPPACRQLTPATPTDPGSTTLKLFTFGSKAKLAGHPQQPSYAEEDEDRPYADAAEPAAGEGWLTVHDVKKTYGRRMVVRGVSAGRRPRRSRSACSAPTAPARPPSST